jgi:lysosomal acid lipase/cholesteryl ester hydrolase
MTQICTENGFKAESFTVLTDDGYALGLWRIPGTLAEKKDAVSEKPVILMMHGLDSDMMEWVLNTAETAPAFVLARAGYDVWMGNNRGSKYSMGHVSMSPENLDFWDFYQEDMAKKDLPSLIEFV